MYMLLKLAKIEQQSVINDMFLCSRTQIIYLYNNIIVKLTSFKTTFLSFHAIISLSSIPILWIKIATTCFLILKKLTKGVSSKTCP